MRIAALYDVHGNRPALEAVLAELEGEQIDEIVFGGDLTWGPQPHETLELVWSVSNARFVRGNADREPDEWERSHLSPEEVAFLQGQPPTVEVDGVLYCHATPRSDEEVVTPATPDERLAEILARVEQRVVVAGHTHMQQDRRVGRVLRAERLATHRGDAPRTDPATGLAGGGDEGARGPGQGDLRHPE